MLAYDPIPWLLDQDGLPALRARRRLGLDRERDGEAAAAVLAEHAKAQSADGSFDGSLMKTAGAAGLLLDLHVQGAQSLLDAAASHIFDVLGSQPGFGRASDVTPGSLLTPCDLAGFFGPYDARNEPACLAHGAREMNVYREFEPLLGPKSPVRSERTSTRDRPGPGSCYAWGLIPLSYTIETLCRLGCGEDERLLPAVDALLGAQRASGGWCRDLGGHPGCTVHAVRAVGVHPVLRSTELARRALAFAERAGRPGFAWMEAATLFDLPEAYRLVDRGLAWAGPKQRRNGTFGGPCVVEKVVEAVRADRMLGRAEPD